MSIRVMQLWAYNSIMTPFVIIRLTLWCVVMVGRLAYVAMDYVPAWRRLDGWSGW